MKRIVNIKNDKIYNQIAIKEKHNFIFINNVKLLFMSIFMSI